MLHVTFGTHKKQSFGSETPERQHAVEPHAKQKTVWNVDSERMAAQSLVSVRLLKRPETPAMIRAHAKQKTRKQNASRHLWNL